MKDSVTWYPSLGEALEAICGAGYRLKNVQRVFGGDANKSFCLTFQDGLRIFMKTTPVLEKGFYEAEVSGLLAIRATDTVKVPEILGFGINREKDEISSRISSSPFTFLLLAFIESPSRPSPRCWDVFAEQLAAMHAAPTQQFLPDSEDSGAGACAGKCVRYGFFSDSCSAGRPLPNPPREKWADFYRDSRLLPKYKLTRNYYPESLQKKAEYLIDHLDRYMPEPDHPSLVHGDMWAGNIMVGSDGYIWLIDPAAYVGSQEMDIAMSELFGGYPREFYRAYAGYAHLDAGYRQRRDLCNLWQLMNHLYLFGGSYYDAVAQIICSYV